VYTYLMNADTEASPYQAPCACGMQAQFAALGALQYNAHVRRAARAVLGRVCNRGLAAAFGGWLARAAAMRGARLLLRRALAGTTQRCFDAWWCVPRLELIMWLTRFREPGRLIGNETTASCTGPAAVSRCC
jgi:hypothetical protein